MSCTVTEHDRRWVSRNAVGLDSGGRWRSNAKGNRRAGRRYGSCCIVIPRQGRNGDVAGRYARRPIRFPDVGCVACKFLRRTAVAAAEFLRVVGCGSSPRVCTGIVQSAQKQRKSALRCCVASPTALSLCSSRCARAEPFSSERVSCCVACLPSSSRSSGALTLIGPAARGRNHSSVPMVVVPALCSCFVLCCCLCCP